MDVNEVSDKQFLESLENIKEDIYVKTFQETVTKEKLQEKFDSQKQRLVKMFRHELGKVVEIFDQTGIPEESPSIIFNNKKGFVLIFPIVRHSTRYVSRMEVNLLLTNDGYEVQIKWLGHNEFLEPPVESQTIKEKILDFLEQRREQIKNIENKYTHVQKRNLPDASA